MSQFLISGFSDEISSDFQIQLEEINKLGIAYIEIRGVNGKSIVEHSIEEVRKIKEQLDDADIRVSAIGSPIGKIQIIDDFEPHFEVFKHTVEIARLLETKYIRLFSFFMEKGSEAVNRDEVIKRMTSLVDFVNGSEIVLLHENEKDIYGDTPERCLDLYDSLNSENFKLIFDPANFVQCNVVTYPDAFNMLKDKVIYYHIKDAIMESAAVVPSGYGDGHIPEIIKELHERNYKGFLSLEPHLGFFEGFNSLEGDSKVPVYEETSDASKFELAYNSLKKIVDEI